MRPLKPKSVRRPKVNRQAPPPKWLQPVISAGMLLGAMFTFVLIGGYTVQSGLWAAGRDKIVAEFTSKTSEMGMTLKEVYAVGRQRTKTVDIRRKIEMFYGQNILTVDIGTMQQEIESLPWIRTAAVSRQLPDRLLIDIQERRPMALWQQNGDVQLIDERGDVVPIVDIEPYMAMPIVSGHDAPEHTADLFKTLLSQGKLARRVTAAQRVDGRRWNVYLDGEIEIRMPDQAIDSAWSMLAAAEAKGELLERAITAVDLRSNDWLILQLMDEAIDGFEERPI